MKEASDMPHYPAMYTVRREGKAWKMLTITEVKPPILGPGNLPR
jgi:hypothetical protein